MSDRNKNTFPQLGLLSRSILNGVVGDYLVQKSNPLAIEMSIYHQLKKVEMNSDIAPQLSDIQLTNKVLILVHGLTNLETVWDFKYTETGTSQDNTNTPLMRRENYGTKLQSDFGYTPLFVRYNTGLPIEANGEQLSNLLQELIEHYPIKIDELVLIGFSMGGLLLRQAQHVAQQNASQCKTGQDETWLNSLKKCFYLGTPHEGSPLEKFGAITSEIVRNIPLDHINHWAEWIDIRSQGIKDLKYGLKHSPQMKQDDCPSFYSSAKHYFVSGSVSRNKDSVAGKAFGDSLVRQNSAVPKAKPSDADSAHFESLPHIPLAHSQEVYEQIVVWLNETPSEVALKRYANETSEQIFNNGPGVSKLEIAKGTADIVSDTAHKVLRTTETVHQSIAAIPFSILRRIPVVKEFSKPVELAHNGISEKIFSSLKAGNKKAKHLTKHTNE